MPRAQSGWQLLAETRPAALPRSTPTPYQIDCRDTAIAAGHDHRFGAHLGGRYRGNSRLLPRFARLRWGNRRIRTSISHRRILRPPRDWSVRGACPDSIWEWECAYPQSAVRGGVTWVIRGWLRWKNRWAGRFENTNLCGIRNVNFGIPVWGMPFRAHNVPTRMRNRAEQRVFPGT